MSEPDHNLSRPGSNPSINSTNGSNRSSDIIDSAPDSSREQDPTIYSPSTTKEESHSEVRLDDVPMDQDSPHQPSQPAESIGAFPRLQEAIASEEVDVISRHQSAGAHILEELAERLSANKKCIDTAQISSVNSLKERATNPRTVLGIVGGTGHGKSSLINALLEEDKLVPTNCFRAFAPSGEVSSEGQLEESDAGIAWAKVKAVYPEVTKQVIEQNGPKMLANDPAVNALLGTTRIVRQRTAAELYEAIQIYVDSKKKTNRAPFDREYNHGRKFELWPLIKVVRIYTKADVLSTGAVIVDLPGVKDSNAARSAVAANYIEKCNGLWVVSMITRAVHDQSAQELLGAQFKRQLQLDGNYSNVTFVCSKTDDISIKEAASDLGLSDEVQKLDEAKHKLSQFSANLKLEMLNQRKSAIEMYAKEVDKHLDRYEKLRNLQAKGEIATPPKEYPRKRKIGGQTPRSHKRRRFNMDEVSQDTRWISTEDCWEGLEQGMPKFTPEQHLTTEDIQSMTDYLRSQKQMATDKAESLVESIDTQEDLLECHKEEVMKLEEELSRACVSKRNEFSRHSIREQFALGLKELDEYEAQRIDPNFDPGKVLRDYNQVRLSLPVFCISSRAYKSLANKERVTGFHNVDDTEVPQLQAHTKKLTETARIRNAKSFLNDLVQTLNSLYLWSAKKNIEIYPTDEEKKAEMEYVREQANELEKRLQLANMEFSRQLNEILEALFKRIKAAALNAAKSALAIAHGWPSRKRGDGGLPFMTYRATLRRKGVFSGRCGPRNFNEGLWLYFLSKNWADNFQDLAAPLLQQVSGHWEVTFAEKIPQALDAHAKTCRVHQEYIQGLIKSRLKGKSAFSGSIGMLDDQDKTRVFGLAHKISSFISDITTLQREANREFTPAIQQKLNSKYKQCAKDKGPGVFARMSLDLQTEIKKHQRAIFNGSCKLPMAKLSEIPQNIQEELQIYIGIMRDVMISDYSNVVLGTDSSEESRIVRQGVFELLGEVDSRFQ
ncbi:hypothetical protein EKO27_g4316 [Xylaria grammica]|uniref:Dynamin N-terminal domain-containing protein n=1 Tax=Xylaria grammica TaxID=363999 RepID=A0A439D8R6_9PEZI|nr:hypothetical protein EKO27_g4316 [Xylaria grammica]